MVKTKIILLSFILCLSLIGIVSSIEPTEYSNYYSYGNFYANTTNNLTYGCGSFVCSSNTLITIFDPTGTMVLNNTIPDLSNEGYITYQLTPDQTKLIGAYTFFLVETETAQAEGIYHVSAIGGDLSTPKSIIFIGFLFILIFLFIFDIIGLTLLPGGNEKSPKGELIGINNLKYLRGVLFLVGYGLMLAITFMASNIGFAYLGTSLMASFFFQLFRLLMLALPIIFILWVIWLFVKIFQDKEFKHMIERGITGDGGKL